MFNICYSIIADCDYPNLRLLSMFSNFKKLIHIGQNSRDRFDVMDGLRVISITWIIAGHGMSSWSDRFPTTNWADFDQVQY